LGLTVTRVDQREVAAFERAVEPNTKLIVLESPSNPLRRLTDLAAVASLASSRGITTLVDSPFATPLNQRPLDLGIDLVFHSGTKYFGGHSDLIAGVVLGTAERMTEVWDTHVVLERRWARSMRG
jgi:cystathionine beta-lyase/cystathionine gamma-synthase